MENNTIILTKRKVTGYSTRIREGLMITLTTSNKTEAVLADTI